MTSATTPKATTPEAPEEPKATKPPASASKLKEPTLKELVSGMAEGMGTLQNVVTGMATDQQSMKAEINALKSPAGNQIGGSTSTPLAPPQPGLPPADVEAPEKVAITPETPYSERSHTPFHKEDPRKRKNPRPKYDPLAPESGLVRVDPPLPAYVELKNQILGEEFGLMLNQFVDRPSMQVVIIVPNKYSNTPPEQRVHVEYDIRSIVVGLATGINDIRKWFGLISENLVSSAVESHIPITTVQEKLDQKNAGGLVPGAPMAPPAMPE